MAKTDSPKNPTPKKRASSSAPVEKITVAIAPGVRTLLKAYLDRENVKPARVRKPLNRSGVLKIALTEFLRKVKLPASAD